MLTYNDQTTVWKFVEEARKKIFSAKTEPDCELTTQNGNIIKADYGEIMENTDKQLNTFSNYDFQENVSTKKPDSIFWPGESKQNYRFSRQF